MNIVKRSLPVLVGLRVPTILERLLFGIQCIGFCADETNTEQVKNCREFCGRELFKRLGCNTTHRLIK